LGKLVRRWELREKYTLDDLMDFHDAMDLWEDMEREARRQKD
jgi:hypothetical protein